MFNDLTVFRTASAMAAHAGRRQAVIARNIANADTPGYKSRDLPDFQQLAQAGPDGFQLRATRADHLNGARGAALEPTAFERAVPPDPNGNTVVLEEELMMAADVRRQHDRALAIYRSAMDILRTSIRVR